MVSRGSARLLLQLLDAAQIPAREDAIAAVTQARAELRAVIATEQLGADEEPA